MLTFPVFGADWWQIFGAILFALIVGKFMRQQQTVMMASLIGALLTASWVGAFIGPILVMMTWPIDIVKKVGS